MTIPLRLLDSAKKSPSDKAIRACVHCGFCLATCPTYALTGDELDSPRGRIQLMKDLLADECKTPSPSVVHHIDRCLSCLSCATTCPSGVDYMHLIDHTRARIETSFRRPYHQQLLRSLLTHILPYPRRLGVAIGLSRLATPFANLFPASVRAMIKLASVRRQHPLPQKRRPPAAEGRQLLGRVALLRGCAEPVLDPGIQQSARRLLARAGYEVVEIANTGCCGALVHHLGREKQSRTMAERNIRAWSRQLDTGKLAAILVTASGCGTALKDYGFLFRNDPELADKAARMSALALDVIQFLSRIALPEACLAENLRVAYHAACSLQHGQKIINEPKSLLTKVGFTVLDVAEGHLCCGSAGVYNVLQPAMAESLGRRKADNIASTRPDVIASGNLGCMTQIALYLDIPLVHTVELLDWATGGPKPSALSRV